MEHQVHTRTVPGSGSAGELVVSSLAEVNAPENNEGDDAHIQRQQEKGDIDDSGVDKTVTFTDHHGDRYVWPFELCRSFEMIKLLLEEIYTLTKDDDNLKRIQQGRYDIQTNDGAIIQPAAWSFIVKPFMIIRISFWRDNPITETRLYRRERGPDSRSTSLAHIWETKEHERQVIFDTDIDGADPPRPPSSNGSEDRKTDESGDDPEVEASTDSNSERLEEPAVLEPAREIILPTDTEGNKLSFAVDTSGVERRPQPLKEPSSQGEGPEALRAMKEPSEAETWRITKAVLTEAESRSMIKLFILPGPENSRLRDIVRITWYHLPAERLDFSRFKHACLAVPLLSDRLQTLTRELLIKIERHKVKAFLGGLFVEPGTVLRADEKCQPDPQSAIFSCIPYFALQPLIGRLSTGSGDRTFPPRTLMQSYYPYESVRERDEEQAYKKLNNSHSRNLVHVPNLWMMNIGSDIVVTCGHQTLAEEMVNSIEITEEDLKQLGTKDITNNTLTNIRFTDWEGRALLFSLDSCRSYFQMEQKLRDLRSLSRDRTDVNSLQMVWNTFQDQRIVTPSNWSAIIRRTDLVFIDLAALDDRMAIELPPTQATVDSLVEMSSTSVPPFFHWPSATKDDANDAALASQVSRASEAKHLLSCLEDAEKSMMSETLEEYDTTNAVDKSFASTSFYQSLPEETFETIKAQFVSLNPSVEQTVSRSHHELVVSKQSISICEQSQSFFRIVQATLKLFVKDVNTSTMLRRVWGAMRNIQRGVEVIKERGAMMSNSGDYTDSKQKQPFPLKRAWFVRSAGTGSSIPQPEADEKFKRSIARCRRCASFRPFANADVALDHVRKHLKPVSQPTQTSQPLDLSNRNPSLKTITETNISDWIVNYPQLKLEETNAGALGILRQACEESLGLYNQAKDLADGVQDEELKMSELYTFPRQLLQAFRQLIVFYLAVERALHYTEEAFQNNSPLNNNHELDSLPYSPNGLEVLKRFSEGAGRSIDEAREELCNMVALNAPEDVLKNISLGPEYVCSWLMRRLLVQPLERKMTIGDIYREYLSTIQFQVNHRPSKRLLRSINLLQEELVILSKVNSWQRKLIRNYMRVLDDTTYGMDILSRRAMFPYERTLLRSCLDNLALSSEDYEDLIRRCEPLSSSTKQILEITEEDHGKAIMVFTLVTIVFLPLSFVTSYLGMNTVDIRDMGNTQSLFWSIAVPLTVVTMGTALFIGYNGDNMRDKLSSLYHAATGKQDRSMSARGISVAQRKLATQSQSGSNSLLDSTSLADEAEYATPRPEYFADEYGRATYGPVLYEGGSQGLDTYAAVQARNASIVLQSPHTEIQTQSFTKSARIELGPETVYAPAPPDLRPTHTTVKRYHIPYGSNSKDPLVQVSNQRHARSEFDDTADIRRNKSRYETFVYDVDHRRVRKPVSNFTPRVSDVRYGNVDDGSVQAYTWHKKRRQSTRDQRRERQTENGRISTTVYF